MRASQDLSQVRVRRASQATASISLSDDGALLGARIESAIRRFAHVSDAENRLLVNLGDRQFSLNVLDAGGLATRRCVTHCEQRYKDRGLPLHITNSPFCQLFKSCKQERVATAQPPTLNASCQ